MARLKTVIIIQVIKTDEKTVMTSLNHSGIPVYWFNFGDTVYFAPKASDDFDIVVFYVPKVCQDQQPMIPILVSARDLIV